MKVNNSINLSSRDIFNETTIKLLDPDAKDLAENVTWELINGLSEDKTDLYPITIIGKGPPIILIHGFDSCFLEYRRLVPYLKNKHTLLIPDLFGFGFTPRKNHHKCNLDMIIFQLNKILAHFSKFQQFGIIGASMGGGIAMELARSNPNLINKLLLLSPAGICGEPKRVPRPFDSLGVCILKNKLVRKKLCQAAFAYPDKSVGPKEEQIASIHLSVPGWGLSLAAFARSGGVANCGSPQPNQPIKVLWGDKDRIIKKAERDETKKTINCMHEELSDCGHLPHLDKPEIVSTHWLDK